MKLIFGWQCLWLSQKCCWHFSCWSANVQVFRSAAQKRLISLRLPAHMRNLCMLRACVLLRTSCCKFSSTRRWRMVFLCLQIKSRFVTWCETKWLGTCLVWSDRPSWAAAWSIHFRWVWFGVCFGIICLVLVTFPGFPLKLTTHLHLGPTLGISGALPSVPCMPFWCIYGQPLFPWRGANVLCIYVHADNFQTYSSTKLVELLPISNTIYCARTICCFSHCVNL